MNAQAGIALKEYVITQNDAIAPGVYVLKYTRDFSFIPGQVVGITVDSSLPPRMYSITSGMQDDEVWILFNIRPGGALTPRLADLKPGDKILASPPMGSFFGTAKPSTWIASGTGIAPFVSMWRSGMKRDKMLIHGGRFLHSFYFQEEFASLPEHDFVRCCSGEPGEGVYHGRLTQWLNGQPALNPNRKYYLCGSAEMVVDTRDILIEKGIAYNNILAEIYF
jgi:ferredoxin/flavodoxin---NADP+ reductase